MVGHEPILSPASPSARAGRLARPFHGQSPLHQRNDGALGIVHCRVWVGGRGDGDGCVGRGVGSPRTGYPATMGRHLACNSRDLVRGGVGPQGPCGGDALAFGDGSPQRALLPPSWSVVS